MFNKIALFVSAVAVVGMLSGCGGKTNSQVYKAADGSFSLKLPNDKWEVTAESADTGMYMFSLPSETQEGDEINNDAMILYYNLSEELGNLSYDTIPTTQEELEATFGDLNYELLNFEGDMKDDVKSNSYSLGYTEGETKGYIVTKTEASPEKGYIIAAEISVDDSELLDEVQKTVDSLKVN